MRNIIPVVVVTLALGCATKLTTAGSMVREVPNPAVRSECEFLGIIEAGDTRAAGMDGFQAGLEGQSAGPIRQTSTMEPIRKIRNKVAEMGGDAYIIVGAAGYEVQAEAYRCNLPTDMEIVPTKVVG